MKIQIKENIKLATDCRTTLSFVKDEIVDIDDERLVKRLIDLGAVECKEEKKSFDKKLENKAIQEVEEDKGIEEKEAKKQAKKDKKKKTK
jgi:hypothetical protein